MLMIIVVKRKFTFQYGEIKSEGDISKSPLGMLFTFQYGEIKSWDKIQAASGETHLHSSMERLKEAAQMSMTV